MIQEYRKAMDGLHLSPEADERIRTLLTAACTDEQEVIPMKHPRKKYSALAIAAIVAVCLLAGTALAVAIHSNFFQAAFGTAVEGQEAYRMEKVDTDGQIIGYESYPAIERVSVNEEAAETLVGEYISAVDQSISAGCFTLTVEELLMDENGIGAVTLNITSTEAFATPFTSDSFPRYYISAETESGRLVDSMTQTISDSVTDTSKSLICYLTPFDAASVSGDVYLRFGAKMSDEGPVEEYILCLSPDERLPATTFAAENGFTAEVSPLGLCFSMGAIVDESGKQIAITGSRDIVIHYTDGSDYVIQSDEVHNLSLASGDAVSGNEWIAFNRLVEPNQIESIDLNYYRHTITPEGVTAEDYSYTLYP